MSESFFQEGKHRKWEQEDLRKQSRLLRLQGAEGIKTQFEYVDSSLEDPGDYRSFATSFGRLLPEEYRGRGLREYIEGTFEGVRGRAVGVEFGGPGARLFEGFAPGFFARTVGVTLAEHRNEKECAFDLETHHVIEGDMRDQSTYDELSKVLGGQKAHVIFERLLGGWDYIEHDPVQFGKILSRWYEMLDEHGMIIAEGPWINTRARRSGKDRFSRPGRDFTPLLEDWKEHVEKEAGETIRMRIASAEVSSSPVFSLERLPGAPEKLPLLPIRAIV